jgi:PKD repeat protein
VLFTDQSNGNGASIVSWFWTVDTAEYASQNANFTFTTPGVYQVTLLVTTSDGCTDQVTYTVTVIPDEIIVPNVFSPNSDGDNDYLEFTGVEYYPNTDLHVFNRWGQTVEAFWHSIGHVRPLTMGLNCSFGATELQPYVADMNGRVDSLVCVYPNAGLPNEMGAYDEPPELTAKLVRKWAEAIKKVRTRDRMPTEWAATQNDLGTALLRLAELENDPVILQEAIEAFEAALLERSRERRLLQWATTQSNLGAARLRLAESGYGIGLLEGAIAAYRSALDAYEEAEVGQAAKTARANLMAAEARMGAASNG